MFKVDNRGMITTIEYDEKKEFGKYLKINNPEQSRGNRENE
jgi:hypothetical protein